MFSTLSKIFEDIAQDVCSFLIAVAIFKLFYWYAQRKQANLPRPLAKKLVSDLSASSASDTDRSGYQARNRTATYERLRTTERRPLKPSTRSESDRAFVPSTSPVGAAPQNAQKVHQSVTRFKEVLHDWGTKHKTVEDNAMSYLQDAIAGLAPHDAAMVKVLLDSKAAEGNGMRQHCRESARDLRPFNQRTWNRDRERDYSSGNRDSSRRSGYLSGAARSDHEQRLNECETSGDSLRANLLELASLDPATVLMVRKINHIGLDSAEVLKAYFSTFGTIERVMVSHCIARSTSGAKRLRPAALGFVIMSKAGEAQAAIAAGEVQSIQGHNITVGTFESHPVS